VSTVESRRYDIAARSTATFGRVIWSCRDQHFVADGPVQNGCPGEAVTPAELFLAGIATCGVELVQVLAKDAGVAVGDVSAAVEGVLDPARPVRDDVRVFNSVRIRFELAGVDTAAARELVEGFKRR
jgi:uncharacterized OsmC-like protein